MKNLRQLAAPIMQTVEGFTVYVSSARLARMYTKGLRCGGSVAVGGKSWGFCMTNNL